MIHICPKITHCLKNLVPKRKKRVNEGQTFSFMLFSAHSFRRKLKLLFQQLINRYMSARAFFRQGRLPALFFCNLIQMKYELTFFQRITSGFDSLCCSLLNMPTESCVTYSISAPHVTTATDETTRVLTGWLFSVLATPSGRGDKFSTPQKSHVPWS